MRHPLPLAKILRAPLLLLLLGLLGACAHALDDARPVEDASKIPLQRAANPALPTLFLVGDSTVKVGTSGQRGWGEEIAPFFDLSKINLVNRAIGGRSSRTFQTEGRWAQVLEEIKPGDFLLIQFGHNDGGDLFKGSRPRASLKGNGNESQEGILEATGQPETVHSFGWYMRKYVSDAQARGATAIVCSIIPRKIWTPENTVVRASDSYGLWAAQAARATGAPFIDLNEIIARRYEALGQAAVEGFFADAHTHTNAVGARLNAECVIAGLQALKPNPLAPFLAAPPK